VSVRHKGEVKICADDGRIVGNGKRWTAMGAIDTVGTSVALYILTSDIDGGQACQALSGCHSSGPLH
jgi:hypothetical protein